MPSLSLFRSKTKAKTRRSLAMPTQSDMSSTMSTAMFTETSSVSKVEITTNTPVDRRPIPRVETIPWKPTFTCSAGVDEHGQLKDSIFHKIPLGKKHSNWHEDVTVVSTVDDVFKLLDHTTPYDLQPDSALDLLPLDFNPATKGLKWLDRDCVKISPRHFSLIVRCCYIEDERLNLDENASVPRKTFKIPLPKNVVPEFAQKHGYYYVVGQRRISCFVGVLAFDCLDPATRVSCESAVRALAAQLSSDKSHQVPKLDVQACNTLASCINGIYIFDDLQPNEPAHQRRFTLDDLSADITGNVMRRLRAFKTFWEQMSPDDGFDEKDMDDRRHREELREMLRGAASLKFALLHRYMPEEVAPSPEDLLYDWSPASQAIKKLRRELVRATILSQSLPFQRDDRVGGLMHDVHSIQMAVSDKHATFLTDVDLANTKYKALEHRVSRLNKFLAFYALWLKVVTRGCDEKYGDDGNHLAIGIQPEEARECNIHCSKLIRVTVNPSSPLTGQTKPKPHRHVLPALVDGFRVVGWKVWWSQSEKSQKPASVVRLGDGGMVLELMPGAVGRREYEMTAFIVDDVRLRWFTRIEEMHKLFIAAY